jgi:hypothetical protein
MDKVRGFYPHDVGSIPARRTNYLQAFNIDSNSAV